MPSRRRTRSEAASPRPGQTRSVRLTRKYADAINGVDLRDAKVGDRLDLPHHEAGVLVAEGWAEDVRASASDSPPRGPRRHDR